MTFVQSLMIADFVDDEVFDVVGGAVAAWSSAEVDFAAETAVCYKFSDVASLEML